MVRACTKILLLYSALQCPKWPCIQNQWQYLQWLEDESCNQILISACLCSYIVCFCISCRMCVVLLLIKYCMLEKVTTWRRMIRSYFQSSLTLWILKLVMISFPLPLTWFSNHYWRIWKGDLESFKALWLMFYSLRSWLMYSLHPQ